MQVKKMDSVKEYERLQRMLLKHEGLRLKPYLDSVGKLTIGIGRNIEDNGISEEEAYHLLNNDIKRCYREAEAGLRWFHGISIVRQDVVINMMFNMGLRRLLGFKRMIIAIEGGDFKWAASEMLNSKWARQVENRAVELAEMMAEDRYPS